LGHLNVSIWFRIITSIDDIDNPPGYKPRYREFLKNQSYYKKVIEFEDPEIVKKIHLNFRISYLRDSVVSSIIDDPLTNQFNTVTQNNFNDNLFLDHILQQS
jgi:Component of IIS longevity pathway SMK-1.